MSQTLGMRIRERRTKLNLTQDELAEKLGMTRANFSSYESDRNIPPSIILGKIADALNVSVDYLLGRIDEPYQIYLNKSADHLSLEDQTLLRKFLIESEELIRQKGDISEEKLSHVLEFMGYVFRKEIEDKKKSQS
ncbi:helix-turn-helix domain-containing protein [Paenibacillus oleatilyticus]|uniref:helix-turn-helix domain-containing protein n=1 Tax=Paenibacillus oleatilyticus TaxID=2594886 RepID=UPI001C1FA19F|nr:helix-turn-helix domain-containing protein [Paenibacillus oleatilyticus]MBU7319037.1 helix-turn-helix domain-containing protein [Paenibacillus oleatilyticus]